MAIENRTTNTHSNIYVLGGDVVPIPVSDSDPYLIWVDANDGRRMGQIKPRDSNNPHLYLQLLLEVWDEGLDASARKHRIANLRRLIRNGNFSTGRARVRGVYDLSVDRFVTMIVSGDKMLEFLQNWQKYCNRFEMAHTVGGYATGGSDDEWIAVEQSKRQASVPSSRKFREQDERLSGTVVAVIDYGCPFAHSSFRSGSQSRVRYVWFQDTTALAPTPHVKYGLPRIQRIEARHGRLFPYGRELRPSLIDSILNDNFQRGKGEAGCYDAIGYDLMKTGSSHGGHVLDIAAGWPNPLKPNDTTPDVAGRANIIFVQLPRAAVGDSSGSAMSAYVLDALHYIDSRVTADAKVVVNLSFGTHAGPHDGSSMLERSIDNFLESRREQFSLVIPAGNSIQSDCHAAGVIRKDVPLELEWEVMPDDPTDTFLEIWHSLDSAIEVAITPPGMLNSLDTVAAGQVKTWGVGDADASSAPILTVVNSASSTPMAAMTLCVLAPTRNREGPKEGEAPYGIWKAKITTTSEKDVDVDAWIERDDPIFDLGYGSRQSRFVVPHQGYEFDSEDEYALGPVRKQKTLNSYSTAHWIVTVGAVTGPILDAEPTQLTQLSPYTAAGPARIGAVNAPKYLAVADESDVLPGVNAAGNNDRSAVRRSGTSVAAPQVTRALANGLTAEVGHHGAVGVNVNVAGVRGAGLSLDGEALQRLRAGDRLLVA